MRKVRTEARKPFIHPLEPVPDGQEPSSVGHLVLKPWSSIAAQVGQDAAYDAMTAGHERSVAGAAYSMAVLVWAIEAWTGVVDLDGEPLAVTPDHVRAFLEDNEEDFFALDMAYVLPGARKDAEKNV